MEPQALPLGRAVGVGAGAVALNPTGIAAAPHRSSAAQGRPSLRPERFGRIFRLRPFAQASPAVEAALRELGRPGGLLDAADASRRDRSSTTEPIT